MTDIEMISLLSPFALALRAPVDSAVYAAYYRVLAKVPAPLFEQALNSYLDEGVRFLPTAPEMRQRSEVLRRSLLSSMPYRGCSDCEHSIGWQAVMLNGVERMTRCRCWQAHQSKLAGMGLGEAVAVLPSVEQPDDGPMVHERAPSGEIGTALQAIANRKVLR